MCLLLAASLSEIGRRVDEEGAAEPITPSHLRETASKEDINHSVEDFVAAK